jgi:1,4-alpha-glucan branching enzyme
MVSRPTYVGGLGFGLKWDLGWMHDTLLYMARDPVHRSHHHNELTFRGLYATSENFVLPLSHDEVVHGKGSLLAKMPGDTWQKFANLRLLFGYQYAQLGKKLLFMGCELGSWQEWSHESSVDWHLLAEPVHAGLRRWVQDLNQLYRTSPALHAGDCRAGSFEWIDCSDSAASVLSWLRKGPTPTDVMMVVCNFTPLVREAYRLGAPTAGRWLELLNSDASDYGGSGQGNWGGVNTDPTPFHGRPYSLRLRLPPLGILLLHSPPGSA